MPPMRILAFGTFDEVRHPRIGVILTGLERHGYSVERCNVPLGFDTEERVRYLQRPWTVPLFVLRILRTWWQLARTARRLPTPDVVIVGYLGHFDVVLARLLFRRAVVVHDMLIFAGDTARDRRAGGIVQRLLHGLDRVAIAASDIVVVDTEEHLAMLPSKAVGVVVPVGAPDAWFTASEPTVHDGPLRVVFFGLYTPLQNAPVIGEALALAGDRVVATMIGDGQDRADTERRADGAAITWLDWVEPDALPAIVREHDVCLGVFAAEGKGTRIVPNKVYQGLAAGCCVVTSDTEPQRRALGDAVIYVPPADPAALAKVLGELADDPDRVLTLRRAARARAASQFRPEAVVRPLITRLEADPMQSHESTTPAAQAGAPLPPLAPNAWLRWDMVERLLPADARTVLEVGAGQGGMGARMARGRSYLGIEPDDTSFAVGAARVQAQGGEFRHGLLADVVDADATFDVVCAFEVIEHIDDDLATVREMVSHLRPGGTLLISVPAFPERFAAADTLAGHFRRYAPADLEQLFVEAGLEHPVVRCYGAGLGNVLEAGRNTIAARRNRAAATAQTGTDGAMAERTAASGRFLQPNNRLAGTVTMVGTWPFRRLQRAFPNTGPGLIGAARRPG